MRRYFLSRTEEFAEICKDVGQIFFASVLLEPIVSSHASIATVSLGILLAFISWFMYTLLS